VNDQELKLVDPVEYFKSRLGHAADDELEMKQMLLQLNPMLQRNALSVGELCDVGFFLRELEAKLDELRKDCSARRSLIGEIIAQRLTKAFLEDPTGSPKRAEGKYSTGTPDVSTHFRVPKVGSREYGELMRSLGVNAKAIEAGAVRPDFNGLADYAGKVGNREVPSTIGRFTRYTTTFRRRGVATTDHSTTDGESLGKDQ
jgi:hypothetical protein